MSCSALPNGASRAEHSGAPPSGAKHDVKREDNGVEPAGAVSRRARSRSVHRVTDGAPTTHPCRVGGWIVELSALSVTTYMLILHTQRLPTARPGPA